MGKLLFQVMMYLLRYKPIFAAKRNKCGVYFSITDTKKSPTHTSKSCLMVSIVEFLNNACVTGCSNDLLSVVEQNKLLKNFPRTCEVLYKFT
jgi:hypothetical protein